ncbi:MAG: YceI family protein [Candidatus Brocadiaceae bacterium]|nr:YceI family protein [Candidatus Brocadiaceae bacterium]
MPLKPGTHHITAGSGRIFIYTFKEGFLSAVAHDLLLEAKNFTVSLNIPPEGAGISNVEAEIHANSLKVLCAMKDGNQCYDTLKEKDRKEIEEAIIKDVLHPGKYPTVKFCSTKGIEGKVGALVKGELTLHGTTHPIEFPVTSASEGHISGKFVVKQKEYGIKPYKALLGTLKVKNEVEIDFELTLPGV